MQLLQCPEGWADVLGCVRDGNRLLLGQRWHGWEEDARVEVASPQQVDVPTTALF